MRPRFPSALSLHFDNHDVWSPGNDDTTAYLPEQPSNGSLPDEQYATSLEGHLGGSKAADLSWDWDFQKHSFLITRLKDLEEQNRILRNRVLKLENEIRYLRGGDSSVTPTRGREQSGSFCLDRRYSSEMGKKMEKDPRLIHSDIMPPTPSQSSLTMSRSFTSEVNWGPSLCIPNARPPAPCEQAEVLSSWDQPSGDANMLEGVNRLIKQYNEVHISPPTQTPQILPCPQSPRLNEMSPQGLVPPVPLPSPLLRVTDSCDSLKPPQLTPWRRPHSLAGGRGWAYDLYSEPTERIPPRMDSSLSVNSASPVSCHSGTVFENRTPRLSPSLSQQLLNPPPHDGKKRTRKRGRRGGRKHGGARKRDLVAHPSAALLAALSALEGAAAAQQHQPPSNLQSPPRLDCCHQWTFDPKS